MPAALGLPPTFRVRDLLDDMPYTWHVGRNYVQLEPGARQAHVLRVEAVSRSRAARSSGEVELIVQRDHPNPHHVLGAHPADGGVVVRTYRPDATAVRVVPEGGEAVDLALAHPGGVFEGLVPGADAAARLPARGRLPGREQLLARRPLPLPAGARRARPPSGRRGPARGAVRAARRPRARDRRRAGRRLRRLGAVGAVGQRRRRLQRLGRAAAPDALARLGGDLGAVRARARARLELQVRDPRAGRRPPAQGRPVRAPHRGAAEERVGRVRAAPRVGRRGVARAARARRSLAQPGLDLRGAPGLVAAQPARRQPQPLLPRARRRAVRLRARPRLHPRRADAGDGAPLRRLLGLPGDRVLRADGAVRLARRLPRLRRPAAPARPRRRPRLGAGALPPRRVGARPLRRDGAVRAPGPAPRCAPGLGDARLQLRAQRGAGTSCSRTRSSGCASTTRTACGWTPWPRCSTSTTRAARASGSRTSTAAARTWRRSRSSRS